MTEGLRSHPHLFLHEHIEQMNKALQGMEQWHTSKTLTPEIRNLVKKAVTSHDLGKGTVYFQDYIKDPKGYKGKPMDKIHTPLSLFFTLAMAEKEGWGEMDTLALAAAVGGHHSSLPTIPEIKIAGVSCPERDIDNFASGEKARTVKRQLPTVNLEALDGETGLSLHDILPVAGEKGPYGNPLSKVKRFLTRIIPQFQAMDFERAVRFRLTAQLVYSILLEADRALLAVADPDLYLHRRERQWQAGWVDKRIGRPKSTATNQIRMKAREEILREMEEAQQGNIFSLTAPTGVGKTLLAATWALKMREGLQDNVGIAPKIIVVLPFLSVIDQTAREYERILACGDQRVDGSWMMMVNSISGRQYSEDVAQHDGYFMIDAWRTELVVTTYDQFLMNLIEPKAKYQMRFHNLCDALIVLDEVQSLPCKLWRILEKVLRGLTEISYSKILLMSATLPPFISDTTSLLPNYKSYFKGFKRYKLCFRLQETLDMDSFVGELQYRLPGWLKNRQRVLITLNTRKSARKIRDSLEECWLPEYREIPLYFISADVTPKDRLEMIEGIKRNDARNRSVGNDERYPDMIEETKKIPCIVVSTQCVEAGVDIDMDICIRDFAPLDSLIQIAGRCNREGKCSNRGIVEVVDLVNDNGKRYSEMIYDPVHLNVTRILLSGMPEVLEENTLELSQAYFAELLSKKDTGQAHLQRFARWQEEVSVQKLLGREQGQFTFLVIEQDPGLKEEMAGANSLENRWERKEAWKSLAGRIAMISINVHASQGFFPQQIADEYFSYWILREGYYSSKCGLLIEGEPFIC